MLDLFLMAQVYLPESLESALEMSSMANPKSEMTFILLELERGFPSMDHSTSSVGSLVGTYEHSCIRSTFDAVAL